MLTTCCGELVVSTFSCPFFSEPSQSSRISRLGIQNAHPVLCLPTPPTPGTILSRTLHPASPHLVHVWSGGLNTGCFLGHFPFLVCLPRPWRGCGLGLRRQSPGLYISPRPPQSPVKPTSLRAESCPGSLASRESAVTMLGDSEMQLASPGTARGRTGCGFIAAHSTASQLASVLPPVTRTVTCV